MEKVFGNDLILERVMNFLDFETLYTARLTNKHWNQFANPRLHEKLALQHFGSDKNNIKKLYKQELQLKISEVRVNLPVSLHLQKDEEKAWKIINDLFSFESWRPRIICLRLSQFDASELNCVLPILLGNLPSLKEFDVGYVNYMDQFRSVVPGSFVAPEMPQDTPLHLKTFQVGFIFYNEIPLDLGFLARCRYLEELYMNISTYPSCCEVLENLANLKVEEGLLHSCEKVHFAISMINLFRENKPILLKNVACILNRIKSKSLNLSASTGLKLPTVLPLISYVPESITVDIPVSKNGTCYTNWLLKTLRKYRTLCSLTELGLRPCVCEWGPGTEPAHIDKPYQHNFEGVKSLKILFDKKEGRYRSVFPEASLYLQKVSSLTLSGLRLDNMSGSGLFGLHNGVRFLEGIQGFPLLQKVRVEMEDNKERNLEKVGREEQAGLLEPLSSGEAPPLRLLEIDLQLGYDMDMDAILFALFAGAEPRFGLSITVKHKAGRMFRKYTADELGVVLASVNPT